MILNGHSLEERSRLDAEFHLQICKMTGNPMMLHICSIIYDTLAHIMPVLSTLIGNNRSNYLHEKLVDTIDKHYIEEAKATMEEHLMITIRAVEEIPENSDMFKRLQ